uniref:uncharacterized protein LOC104266779 n=1 Tax=Ciona intestinalis TaxID=7719 RepID=UPI00089DC407|nr:uncharacterized protein LOC104266779 [Ciona intestinalis]|eukprot:XP_018672864.1 uncharacterized protein LOC104266779 [Ciona intestinalis]
MNECTGSWPLLPGGNCSIQAGVVDSNSNNVCTPISVNISQIEFQLAEETSFSGSSNDLDSFVEVIKPASMVGYAVVSWLPCPSGLRGVTGFQVLIQRIEGTQEDTECHNVTLRRTLQEGDAQIRLSVLSYLFLTPASEYRVEIRSLPITPNSGYVSKTFNSKSCLELNRNFKDENGIPTNCECGETLDSLPPPTVTVEGYSVTMSIPVVPRCYFPGGYFFYEDRLAFWQEGNLGCGVPRVFLSGKSVISDIFAYNNTRSFSGTSYTFSPVYNSIGGRSYTGYSRSDFFGAPIYSRYINFTITAWEPPRPIIHTLTNGMVDVTFEPANSSYHINQYMVRLNKHQLENTTILEDRNISARYVEDGFLTVRYADLEPGVYSAQVREIRQEVQFVKYLHFSPNYVLFADAEYGPLETFTVSSVPSTQSYFNRDLFNSFYGKLIIFRG